jgi:hypothetical protein
MFIQGTENGSQLTNMPEWYDIVTENWSARLQQISLIFNLRKPWAPLGSAALAYGASFVHSPLLRITTIGVALLLFLIAATEIAGHLLEPDQGPINPLRHSERVPVTPLQVILTWAMASIYTFLILGALEPIVAALARPTLWTIVIVAALVFLLCCLVAWRNVRLWSYEGAEYEELLNEEKNALAEKERLKQMRRPSSSWEGPAR